MPFRVEAEGWSALLSRNWSLETARRAAESCVHSSDQVHWLDQGTEHPHRIALSVHKELIQEVEEKIKDAVDLAGYKAQFIVSGSGEYQYMDILSIHGGKRNAMEYVRQIYGVAPSRVVAAGDSGNDILMLQGVYSPTSGVFWCLMDILQMTQTQLYLTHIHGICVANNICL